MSRGSLVSMNAVRLIVPSGPMRWSYIARQRVSVSGTCCSITVVSKKNTSKNTDSGDGVGAPITLYRQALTPNETLDTVEHSAFNNRALPRQDGDILLCIEHTRDYQRYPYGRDVLQESFNLAQGANVYQNRWKIRALSTLTIEPTYSSRFLAPMRWRNQRLILLSIPKDDRAKIWMEGVRRATLYVNNCFGGLRTLDTYGAHVFCHRFLFVAFINLEPTHNENIVISKIKVSSWKFETFEECT